MDDHEKKLLKILLPEKENDIAINMDEEEKAQDRGNPQDPDMHVNKAKVVPRIKGRKAPKFINSKKTPAHQAAEVGDAERLDKLLKENSSSPEEKDEAGQTPLHLAAKGMQLECCRILLGASTKEANIKDKSESTPLMLSISSGATSFKTTDLLLSHTANIYTPNKAKLTALHIAADKGNLDTIKLLLEKDKSGLEIRDRQDSTPLHFAAKRGYAAICKELIAAGADKDAQDCHGNTALHWAAKRGFTECIQVLLEMKCDVNCKDKNNNTPLHLFCLSEKDRPSCANILLTNGADPNVKNLEGKSPFHVVQFSPFEVKTVFKDYPIDLMLTDNCGKTALHYASGRKNDSKHVAFILSMKELTNINKETFINAKDEESNTALHIALKAGEAESCKLLIKNGADINIICDSKGTALHIAAEKGLKETCSYLIDKGIKVDSKNTQSLTPLHLAARNGQSDCCEILLKKNADIKEVDTNGNTALHFAAVGAHISCCEVIMNLRPNAVSIANRDHKCPLHIAIEKKSIECCKTLVTSKCDLWGFRTENVPSPMRLAYDNELFDIFEYLIQKCSNNIHEKPEKVDIDFKKLLGDSLNRSNKTVVRSIIESEFWEESLKPYVMQGSLDIDEDCKRSLGENKSPLTSRKENLRNLIAKFPDLAKKVFDRCTPSNVPQTQDNAERSSDTADSEIISETRYTLRYIDDLYLEEGNITKIYTDHLQMNDYLQKQNSSECSKAGSEEKLLPQSISNSPSASTSDIFESESGKIVKNSKIKKLDHVWRRDHVLSYVMKEGHEELLTHPIVSCWINYKWKSYVRYGFTFSVIWALIHALFLTTFSAKAWDWREMYDKYHLKQTLICESAKYKVGPEVVQHLREEAYIPNILKYAIFAMMFLWAILHIYKIAVLRTVRLDFPVVCGCFIANILFLSDFTACSRLTYVREDWQWIAGPVALVFGWLNVSYQYSSHIHYRPLLFSFRGFLEAARDIIVPLIPVVVIGAFFSTITPKGSLTLIQEMDWFFETFSNWPSIGKMVLFLIVAIVLLAQVRSRKDREQKYNKQQRAINLILDFDVMFSVIRNYFYVAWIPVKKVEDTSRNWNSVKSVFTFTQSDLTDTGKNEDISDLLNTIQMNVALSQDVMANIQTASAEPASLRSSMQPLFDKHQALITNIQLNIAKLYTLKAKAEKL